jgi:hypothetical protein
LTVTKPQNATLIDSISEGYAAINRRPWLLLVPIVLNLYLWFGAQLTFAPLITSAVETIKRLQPSATSQGDMQPMYDQLLSIGGMDVRQQVAFLNAVPTLQMYVVGAMGQEAGVELPTRAEVLQPINTLRADTIEIATIGGALLALLVINMLALSVSAIFLTQVGAAVRRHWLPSGGLRSALKVGLAVLGAFGAILGVGLALGLPFLFFASLLMLLNQTLGLLALNLIYVLAFWVNIYIGFYQEAIVIGEQGPLRAIYTSFNVVRRNFWGTLGFLAISLVISLGSGVIWHQLIGSTAGLVIAIVGSAYIGSGLLAARMAFFRERLRRWQSAPAQPPGVRARS